MNLKRNMRNDFFTSDAKTVATNLLGKFLCRRFEDGTVRRWCIIETEAYGEETVTYKNDLFCGTGKWCFYFGMLMINCKDDNHHDNVLIRAVDCINGPCKITESLKIKDVKNEINEQDVLKCPLLWIEDWGATAIIGTPRKRKGLVKKAENQRETEEKKNYFAEAIHFPYFAEENQSK